MQFHRNVGLLKNRLRLSVIFFVASIVCLLGGFIVSTRLTDLSTQYMVSLTTMGFGIILWWQNKIYLARWGPRSQQDGAIMTAMKGVDSRYHFFAFPSSQLPDYMVVGPMGVMILVTRAVTGSVSCNEGRWTHDEGTPFLVRLSLIMSPRPTLGNPGVEAERSVDAVRRHLRRRLGSEEADAMPVEGVVVLTAPSVKLTVQGCTTPVLFLRSLRSHVRRAPRALTSEQVNAVVAALDHA